MVRLRDMRALGEAGGNIQCAGVTVVFPMYVNTMDFLCMFSVSVIFQN